METRLKKATLMINEFEVTHLVHHAISPPSHRYTIAP